MMYPPVPPPPPARRRRVWPWIVGGVLLVGGVASTVERVPSDDTTAETPAVESLFSDERACDLIAEAVATPVTEATMDRQMDLIGRAYAEAEPEGEVETALADLIDLIGTNDMARAREVANRIAAACGVTS